MPCFDCSKEQHHVSKILTANICQCLKAGTFPYSCIDPPRTFVDRPGKVLICVVMITNSDIGANRQRDKDTIGYTLGNPIDEVRSC